MLRVTAPLVRDRSVPSLLVTLFPRSRGGRYAFLANHFPNSDRGELLCFLKSSVNQGKRRGLERFGILSPLLLQNSEPNEVLDFEFVQRDADICFTAAIGGAADLP